MHGCYSNKRMIQFESNASLTSVVFYGNQASYGGGMWVTGYVTLSIVAFGGNVATYGGGCTACSTKRCWPTLQSNGNRAVNGGGIYIVDLDGNPRIALGIMVMGAYEYQPTSYIYLPLIFGGIGP